MSNPNPVLDAVKYEESLKAGDECEARWTNSGNAYRAKARVVKINRASIRVEIIDSKNYLNGRQIPVPRFTINTVNVWSDNNRLAPLATIPLA